MKEIAELVTYDELESVGTREAYSQIKKKYGIDIVDMLVKQNYLRLHIAALENHLVTYEDLVAEILSNKQ